MGVPVSRALWVAVPVLSVRGAFGDHDGYLFGRVCSELECPDFHTSWVLVNVCFRENLVQTFSAIDGQLKG